jgi:hypothetical protein
LEDRGYDCFFDNETLGSGGFPAQIEANIKSRVHFVLILTPSALERCVDPDDWVRREIELAFDTERNVIPMIFDGFDYAIARAKGYLASQQLLKLPETQSVPVYWEFFDAAVDRLAGANYLGRAVDVSSHKLDDSAQQQIESAKQELESQPAPTEDELTAEEYFERGNTEVEENRSKIRQNSR